MIVLCRSPCLSSNFLCHCCGYLGNGSRDHPVQLLPVLAWNLDLHIPHGRETASGNAIVEEVPARKQRYKQMNLRQ